jgi:glutamyl-tRNA(Gln) amidotransferase subunit D
MKVKMLNAGDKVSLKTKSRTWEGMILESYDPEVVLLKLVSGYNIGIRENEVLDVKVLEKAKDSEKAKKVLEAKSGLPNVAMVITGGTISARLDPKTGGTTWTDAEEILNIAPEISEVCNVVKLEKPFMKASEDMAFLDWKKLAVVCEKLLNDDKIDGVIITHGTDFLHYTAAALSFFLGKLNKPVALTYSQRSIDRGSTDAALNLVCAARYAVSDVAEVALVGHKNLDDEVCLAMPGTKVRKMHTSRRDTFRVVNDAPIAEISAEGMKIMREFNARDNERKVKIDARFADNVALVNVFPGHDPEILEHYVSLGYKGIVLGLGGLGHVPGSAGTKANWLPVIKRLVKKGIVICGTAQTVYGGLNPNVYSAGRELQKTGITFLGDMLSETAFVKLGWVLGHNAWTRDKMNVKAKEKMLENVSGEFNSELGVGGF